MKVLRITLTLALLIIFVSCENKKGDDLGGTNVTSEFLSLYSGSYNEVAADNKTPGEKMKMDRDGSIEVTRLRDVGVAGNPVIPPGTHCSYVLKGQIRYVIQVAEANRTRINPTTKKTYLDPASHKMTFTVLDAQLTNTLEPSTTNNSGCQLFLVNMKQDLPTFTYPMELFGPGNLRLHTKDYLDYRGEDQTLILDEVYVRQ